MRTLKRLTLTGIVLTGLLGVSLSAENWPHWRGRRGRCDERNRAPESLERHGERRLEEPARRLGVSSPIVWGDRVFVTSQAAAGQSRVGPRLGQGAGRQCGGTQLELRHARRDRSVRFLVEALNRADGRRLWTHTIDGRRRSAVGARQAQPGQRQPGDRWRARVCRLRLGPGRRRRRERQAGLEPSPRQGLRAVRHQLGQWQLADRLPQLAHPRLLPRGIFIFDRARYADRQTALEDGQAARRPVVQHAARRAGAARR